jgi:hypothetical protein
VRIERRLLTAARRGRFRRRNRAATS